jgi:hypothetical protein
MNWEYLYRAIRRLWTLEYGYEANPTLLKTGTLTATAPAGQCIYQFVSLSAANTISTATDIDDTTVLAGDIPQQGLMVKVRLKVLTFTAITGTVLVYMKNIKDEAV